MLSFTIAAYVCPQRDKLQRQLNYARSINDRNRQDYEHVARKPKSRSNESDLASEDDMMDRRKLVRRHWASSLYIYMCMYM